MSTRINTEDFIEALFTKNKALYGDARMELVEDDAPTTEETTSEDPPAEGEPVVEEATEEESTEEESENDPDPAWLQKELTRARKEAAKYRTELRDAQTKLSEAKTPEEVEAAISELRDTNAKLERQILVNKVAAKHDLPDALADRLKGSTLEELEADAKLLASVATAPAAPSNLEGGLSPDDDDEDTEMDPKKLASRFRRI